MGLFRRPTADELRAEAALMEACRDEAAQWQEITGTSHLHPLDDKVAAYQYKLDQINKELKSL
ncbi:hypothetical protein [Streptomyces indicus]|uniref:Uncharacterized protein n=1 Tax=Streptomyces indicus TaxID=417292 RepID=A0A1G9ITX3_9ACTN|nr:hypothetical protein [Streptomyces indicus]SDL28383.1 hypothetical protein SAMN05421806_12556 [Streptomyces indicus]